MGFLFNRPAPQQAVPQDLGAGRQQIINALFGQGPRSPTGALARSNAKGGPAQQTQNVLQTLLGLTNSQTPGGDVLGPLASQFHDNLNYAMSAINASSPGRFSTANTYTLGQASQRALNDYNVLASQVLEHGRDRQLQAIMGLLGPVLGPTFGGPFTQGASPWENILGGVQTLAGIPGLGGAAQGVAGNALWHLLGGPA